MFPREQCSQCRSGPCDEGGLPSCSAPGLVVLASNCFVDCTCGTRVRLTPDVLLRPPACPIDRQLCRPLYICRYPSSRHRRLYQTLTCRESPKQSANVHMVRVLLLPEKDAPGIAGIAGSAKSGPNTRTNEFHAVMAGYRALAASLSLSRQRAGQVTYISRQNPPSYGAHAVEGRTGDFVIAVAAEGIAVEVLPWWARFSRGSDEEQAPTCRTNETSTDDKAPNRAVNKSGGIRSTPSRTGQTWTNWGMSC